ncbi:hypothetical protein BaRGS_00021985 [Batillaria attramentaria]|uniref:Uncharacterized protein n=1 Tax=Batillaria attramentaria TaxID=370345 RepID=A0ABD0KID0_9CAEN
MPISSQDTCQPAPHTHRIFSLTEPLTCAPDKHASRVSPDRAVIDSQLTCRKLKASTLTDVFSRSKPCDLLSQAGLAASELWGGYVMTRAEAPSSTTLACRHTTVYNFLPTCQTVDPIMLQSPGDVFGTTTYEMTKTRRPKRDCKSTTSPYLAPVTLNNVTRAQLDSNGRHPKSSSVIIPSLPVTSKLRYGPPTSPTGTGSIKQLTGSTALCCLPTGERVGSLFKCPSINTLESFTGASGEVIWSVRTQLPSRTSGVRAGLDCWKLGVGIPRRDTGDGRVGLLG